MEKLRNICCLVCVVCLSLTSAIAEETSVLLSCSMLSGLYSERSEVKDKIETTLTEPVYIKLSSGDYLVPSGTLVIGEIVEIAQTKRALKSASAVVKFSTLQYADGRIANVDGVLMDPTYRSLNGKVSKQEKLLMSGKLAIGTLLGGPVGTVIAGGTLLFDKGGKISIKPGDPVYVRVTRFEEPIGTTDLTDIDQKALSPYPQ